MIISHKYKFIFIKTFKTASSSFEAAYSWLAGPDDILTPDEPATTDYNQDMWYTGDVFFNHMHGAEIMKHISLDVWSSYYKFCIERNPWDKAISWYYWNRQFWETDMSLSEFVQGHLNKPDWPVYAIEDRVVVDEILRFENLYGEIDRVCDLLGIPRLKMPQVKGAVRPRGINYRDVLGTKEREKIAGDYSKIIKLMNYSF